jgi:dihydrofolate synthase/folylpolyglutamate synthase
VVPEDRVTAGLDTVVMPGRMEVLKTSPRVVLDGAHNAESVMWLMKTLSGQMARDSMVVIFGCAADKDTEGMLREMAGGADKVIFTKSDNARAADPKDLARRYMEMSGKMCQVAPNARAAIELAKKGVAREDLICVTGSLYLVAEVRRLLGLK